MTFMGHHDKVLKTLNPNNNGSICESYLYEPHAIKKELNAF